MIILQIPFKVPIYNPSRGLVVMGVLTCMFDEKNAIVEIDGVKYHCIVNQAQFLELSDHADEKHLKLHAVDGVNFIGAPE